MAFAEVPEGIEAGGREGGGEVWTGEYKHSMIVLREGGKVIESIMQAQSLNRPLWMGHQIVFVFYLHWRLGWLLEDLLGGILHQGPDVSKVGFRFSKKVIDELDSKMLELNRIVFV